MILVLKFFFILSFGIVISSSFVVFSSNPVYSLLWLVLSFVFSAGFLLILGSEFLALIFIVVYVGAIAVLFLFVVMLLDLKLKNLQNKKNQIFSTMILMFGSFFFLFLLFLNFIKYKSMFLNFDLVFKKCKIEFENIIFYLLYVVDKSSLIFINWIDFINSVNDIQLFSLMLYDVFVLQFLIVGLILLAVLIGVVYLTNSYVSTKIKEQSIFKQISINSSFFTR